MTSLEPWCSVVDPVFTCWPSGPGCHAARTEWTEGGLWCRKLLCCLSPPRLLHLQPGAAGGSWRRWRGGRRSAGRVWPDRTQLESVRPCPPPQDCCDLREQNTVIRIHTWYNDAHTAKGKSVFLERMKKFVEWLKNPEEESESEEEETDLRLKLPSWFVFLHYHSTRCSRGTYCRSLSVFSFFLFIYTKTGIWNTGFIPSCFWGLLYTFLLSSA